jgi:hypothetical protein
MDNNETIFNALGVNRKAEGELIGVALRYELHSGRRLNWMIDTAHCIAVLNEIVNCNDNALKNRGSKFYQALTPAEKEQLTKKGIVIPAHDQNPIDAIEIQNRK